MQEKERNKIKKEDKKMITDERVFINKKHGRTIKDLDRREIELQDLIVRKQERSKKEF